MTITIARSVRSHPESRVDREFANEARRSAPRTAPLPVVRNLAAAPAWSRGAVVMIGNFDGFHLGHRALLNKARTVARGRPVAILTPDPHPTCFFAPESAPFQLSPGRMKLRLFEEAGVDFVFLPRFDRRFAVTTAHQFVNDVLIRALDVDHVVVGYDFRFGAKRQGDTAMLQALMRAHGRGITVVGPQSVLGDICSSSRIRQCLERGDVMEAAHLLGAPWRISAAAMLDRDRGQAITVRLPLGPYLRPASGRYVVTARLAATGAPVVGRATVDTVSRIVALELADVGYGHLPAVTSTEVAFLERL